MGSEYLVIVQLHDLNVQLHLHSRTQFFPLMGDGAEKEQKGVQNLKEHNNVKKFEKLRMCFIWKTRMPFYLYV